MIEEGTILQQRYRIGKHIGQGGMGAVYLATDERFGSTVAIKETLFFDDHFKKAFKREARLLNSLKHSALPKVSDHFIENFGQYIVMEYIGGDDLFETMEKRGRAFNVDEVLDWTVQLLNALEYLHGQENPVIHRDIKPQNLKLTTEGQIVLLDFGLAKGNPTDANHQTAANSIFGYSRNYASLEQIQGTGTDPRSDLYSLAATVYHLLTGKPPADALTRVMMVLNEEKDPLIPAHDVLDFVPEDFSSLLLQTMSLNANQRPQTAVEMREMLEGTEITEVIQNPRTVSGKGLETNFYSNETKVLAPELADGPKTERETEVLPVISGEQKSFVTRVANPPTDIGSGAAAGTPSESSRRGIITRSFPTNRRFATAVLFGVLMLVGSVAAGVYLFNPGLLGFNTTAVKDDSGAFDSSPAVSNSTGNENVPIEKAADPSANSADLPDPAGNVQTPNDQEMTKSDRTSKPAETDSSRSDRKTVKTERDPGSDPDTIILPNGQVISIDAIVDDAMVEAKEMKADQSRVTIKRPPTAPREPVISPEEFKSLTPEQRRKVRQAIESWRTMENRRRKRQGLPPIPKPPPPD